MEQNSFYKRLTIKRRLHALLAVALLVGAIGATACSEGEDTDVSNVGGSKNAKLTEADIKSLSNVNSETLLALDEIGGQLPQLNTPIIVNSQSGPTITVRGWAVDQRAKLPAAGVIINVDGTTDVLADYGAPRPDVASNLKSSDYLNSGFRASLDATKLAKGRHTLTMRIVTVDRKGYFEQKQKYDLEIQ